jgi:mono/diheme cytochrome c family protein
MLRSTIIKGIGLMVIFASGLACEQKRIAPVPEDLQQQIATGESIFYKKECGKCHGADNAEAPKLTAVYLAEDTLAARYRLSHIAPSNMPPIPLTQQEISALAHYITTLHAKAYTPANLTSHDARCPVCGAALQKATAIKNGLETSVNGNFYYFECPDCKNAFLSNPRLYSRSAYARANKN